jgi:hypothetical protein
MLTREKDQGERAERRKIAEQLGIDPDKFDPAALKQIVDAKLAQDRAAETEAQRLQREAQEDRDKAKAEREAAAADRLAARRTTALLAAGVALPAVPQSGDTPEAAAERAAALNQAAALLDITPDADDAAVTAAVDTLKVRFPGLFTTSSTPPTTRPAPSGGPTGTPPRPQPSGDAYDRGAERAKKLAPAAASA